MRSSGMMKPHYSVALVRMTAACTNGRCARKFLHSDCVIDEKTVVLQKKDNEGFGFVLRGAKGKGEKKERTLHVLTPPSGASYLYNGKS